jgi:hypothetical protein
MRLVIWGPAANVDAMELLGFLASKGWFWQMDLSDPESVQWSEANLRMAVEACWNQGWPVLWDGREWSRDQRVELEEEVKSRSEEANRMIDIKLLSPGPGLEIFLTYPPEEFRNPHE